MWQVKIDLFHVKRGKLIGNASYPLQIGLALYVIIIFGIKTTKFLLYFTDVQEECKSFQITRVRREGG